MTFSADEGGQFHPSLLTHIPVFDDDIDEADKQFFIVQLILTDAIDRTLIQLTRSFSRCVIIDNDCKF